MNEAAWLEQSELSFFLKHMFTQVCILKPDDSLDFAEKYFRRVRSCHNVLGADYAFITGCRQNRRAFVFCLMELFETFSLAEEMSVIEYQQLVELICPDFPRQIVIEAAYAVEAKNPTASPPKYAHGDLRVAVYFHIIYDEWLKSIEAVFREHGTPDYLSLFRAKSHFEAARNNPSLIFEHPPIDGLEETLSVLSSYSSGGDITMDGLRRVLFVNPIIAADVCRVSRYAQPLLAAASATSTNGSSTSSLALPIPSDESASSSGALGGSESLVSARGDKEEEDDA